MSNHQQTNATYIFKQFLLNWKTKAVTAILLICCQLQVVHAEEAETGTGTDLPTGNWLSDWFMTIVKNAFVVMLAYQAVKAFGKKAWVQFVTLFVAGAIAAFFIYFPNEAVELLKKFGGKVGD